MDLQEEMRRDIREYYIMNGNEAIKFTQANPEMITRIQAMVEPDDWKFQYLIVEAIADIILRDYPIAIKA